MSDGAFFRRLTDDRFLATDHTEGPWSPGAQHGGPPAALLGRALERVASDPSWLTARVSVDILGPIPVGELSVHAEVLRPGRSVELLSAELSAGARVVARAQGWRIRTVPGDPVVPPTPDAPPPPGPGDAHEVGWPGGYLRAIEWRTVQGGAGAAGGGGFGEPGAATQCGAEPAERSQRGLWARPRLPLVEGEEMSPLQRVLLVADSGNGASSELPISDFWFINPELTVHLHRPADGEWICLKARTTVSGDGVGLAESVLYDRRGTIGRGAQALLVGPRKPAVE